MSYYYEMLNKDTVELLADEIGKTAHLVRNYCQGYVNLNYPEILTLDNIAGQIEAQSRQIKGKMMIKAEIKPIIILIAKSAVFLKKITTIEFFNSKYPQEKIETIRLYLSNMSSLIENMDSEVNNSIIKLSEEIFTGNVKSVSINKLETPLGYASGNENNIDTSYIDKEFLYIVNFDKKTIDTEKNITSFKTIIEKLGCFLTNNSHRTQDVVADYIDTEPYKTSANMIINLSGTIENQGRIMIAECNANMNIDAIKKALKVSTDNIISLKNYVNGKEFTIADKFEDLNDLLKITEDIHNSINLVLEKGYNKSLK